MTSAAPTPSGEAPAGPPPPAQRGSVLRRSGRGLLVLGGVTVLAAGLLAAGAAFGGATGSTDESAGKPATAPNVPVGTGIPALQETLRRVPKDDRAWAQLGAAYVQQARLNADPGAYGRADGAFTESLRLHPTGNDLALTGQASLAASRHEFTQAITLSDQALALNAYSAAALAVKVDGLVEQGQYAASRDVLSRLLQLKPGVDAFTRASYAFELQGDVDDARKALQQALGTASAPSDKAFCSYYLGELAWNTGDVDGASAAYDEAVREDPTYVAAQTGQAKVKAARGDLAGAEAEDRLAVLKQPQPATLVELGELLEAQGKTQQAQQQYQVVRATQQLYVASGQVVDAELSLFEADHGDPAKAVALAQKAYAARPDSITAQDAYGWALHAAGRDREALPLAQAALRTGLHSAPFRYHLGVIEAALGQDAAARADLQTALTVPAWNALQPQRARALLARLP